MQEPGSRLVIERIDEDNDYSRKQAREKVSGFGRLPYLLFR
jgi:hypothetical protein